jgi:hypothetical protein
MRITHGTLGEIVELLEADAPPAAVFAAIDTFNSGMLTCGRAVSFLKEADGQPGAA